MALKPIEERFVILWFKGKMTVEQMAKSLRVNERTIYRYKNNPEVRAKVNTEIERATLEARMVLARNVTQAAETEVLYLQREAIPDPENPGKVKGYELKYPGRALQAARDIQQALEIPVKGKEGPSAFVSPVRIYLPDNRRGDSTKAKPAERKKK